MQLGGDVYISSGLTLAMKSIAENVEEETEILWKVLEKQTRK